MSTREIIEKYYESSERESLLKTLEGLVSPVLYAQNIFSAIHGQTVHKPGVPISTNPDEWISKKVTACDRTAHDWFLAHSKQWLEKNGFQEAWKWRKKYLGF